MKSYHQITPVKHQEHHAVGTYGKDEIGIATDSFILVLGYYWEERISLGHSCALQAVLAGRKL
jgi:hypothetical protein